MSPEDLKPAPMPEVPPGHQQITLGGGCFWCVEAVYNRLEGVKSAVSGYTAGHTKNPIWKLHDPTTLNRQGNDVGTQYRSGIYYYSESQKQIAEQSLKEAQSNFKSKIVTEIERIKTFYPAEIGHQNYYHKNGSRNGYCRAVISPKIKKLNLKDKPKIAE